MPSLLDRLTDLEKRPAARAYDTKGYDLAAFREWLRTLGDPQLARPALHIAGTKGKGSTAAMTEALLRGAGLRTGLFTSPHLEHYGQRFRLDGQPLTLEQFHAELAAMEPFVELRPGAAEESFRTVFEVLTAMAFRLFREREVDAAIYEVGLGGRLDTTNVVEPVACAITPIGLDHTKLLGNTVAEIAREKAGIIKPGVPVVLFEPRSDQQAQAHRVLVSRAAEITAPVLPPVPVEILERRVLGQRVRATVLGQEMELELPLLGDHQAQNLGVALALAEVFLRRTARAGTPPEALARGLATTHWPGRLEVYPGLVLDGAHCPMSARALGKALPHIAAVAPPPWLLLWGMQADKDSTGFLRELLASVGEPGRLFHAVCYEVPGGRGAKAADLAALARGMGMLAEEAADVEDAVRRALAAPEGGSVLATGTLYTLKEIQRRHREAVRKKRL